MRPQSTKAFPKLLIASPEFTKMHQRALNEQKDKMNNKRSIVTVLTLVVLSIIGVSAQAQPRSNRVSDRQVSNVLQRLERSSNRFRASLNLALVNGRIDETRPQNDINTFEPALQTAIDQFRVGFNRRQASAADVEKELMSSIAVGGDGVFTVSDERGRKVLIPVSKIAYVDLGEENARHVGFGAV